ncbi:hypothetical protein IWZ00DRAFT_516775 [Phyllosticta capitalensis]
MHASICPSVGWFVCLVSASHPISQSRPPPPAWYGIAWYGTAHAPPTHRPRLPHAYGYIATSPHRSPSRRAWVVGGGGIGIHIM